MAQMLTAASQGNELYTGIASKDTLNSLRSFTNSIRAIAACSVNNPNYQENLIESARLVLQQSIGMVLESRVALENPNESAQNQSRLTQIARSIAQSIYECVNCLPGQKDIDDVIKSIGEYSAVLFGNSETATAASLARYGQSNDSDKNIQQVQQELNESALSLNAATNQIVIESRKPSSPQQQQHLTQSIYKFSDIFGAFLQNALTFATHLDTDEQRAEIVRTLKDVYTCSNKLLHSAKSCMADPNSSISRQQLAIAVKQVTENINTVVNICLQSGNNPVLMAQKECDNALRDIETTRTIVQATNAYDDDQSQSPLTVVISEPPTNATLYSYYDCLDSIIEQSRVLGESMTGIANSCKAPLSPSLFCKSIKDTSKSICGLVETAAHSAYIIGVSDVESKRGRSAILDATHFLNCSQNIQDTCVSLQALITNAGSTGSSVKISNEVQKQLIHAATQIAHNTATLCSASQQASSRTSNVLAKRHFVQSAKQVANATAQFVKSIKSLDAAAAAAAASAPASSNGPSTSATSTPSGQQQTNGSVASGEFEFKHETYVTLVKPLIESVESLCQYALSPEFASIPAVISSNGAKAQEPILQATRTMLDAAYQLIQASRSLIANNKEAHLWQLFSTNSKIISESIKRLATSIKEKAPAKTECDRALSIIDKCMKHLESALIAVAMNQKLPLSEIANAKSLQAYQEHAISCSTQIMELIDQLRVAAKGEADKLGHLVTEISQYFEPLVVNVIGCAAKTPFNSQQQGAYLEQTKTVLESTLQLMIASKECAGNPKNTANLHQTIDENADGTKEVLDDLIQTLEEATAQYGFVTTMVDNLSKAIAKVDLGQTNSTHQVTIKLIFAKLLIDNKIIKP
jgi:talin